jgi:hypothetical protein
MMKRRMRNSWLETHDRGYRVDTCAFHRKNSRLLSNLASIAAEISGLSATASLIYVGIQTRQCVRHAWGFDPPGDRGANPQISSSA